MTTVLNRPMMNLTTGFRSLHTIAKGQFCSNKSRCTVTPYIKTQQRYLLQNRTNLNLIETRLLKSCSRCAAWKTAITMSEKKIHNLENLRPEEKAEQFQRPKAQTTIDEEEVSKFSDLSALWWDEGGEFEALHSLNDLRIPLIRDGLVSQKRLDQYKISRPLDDLWILDVGSGGGILSEPLARLGASVIGLEASEENIKIAQAHVMHDPEIRDRIKYIHATVESISNEQEGKFDAVVASEVLEHVAEPETFVSSCCQLVRPGGSVFFTTLNKTNLSYGLGIVVAERVLGLVSPGTHDWNKFIQPRDLQFMLEQNDFTCRLIHGMWYNPLSKRWMWTKDTSINYAIHAIRSEDPQTTEGKEDVWTEKDAQSR